MEMWSEQMLLKKMTQADLLNAGLNKLSISKKKVVSVQ